MDTSKLAYEASKRGCVSLMRMYRGGGGGREGGRVCGVGGLAPVSDLNAYLQPVLYSNLSVRDVRYASLSFRSIWGGFGAERWYLASV